MDYIHHWHLNAWARPSLTVLGQFGTGQFGAGQFGTGQFGTRQFGTGQFCAMDNLAPDNFAPDNLALEKIWHQDNLTPWGKIDNSVQKS